MALPVRDGPLTDGGRQHPIGKPGPSPPAPHIAEMSSSLAPVASLMLSIICGTGLGGGRAGEAPSGACADISLQRVVCGAQTARLTFLGATGGFFAAEAEATFRALIVGAIACVGWPAGAGLLGCEQG